MANAVSFQSSVNNRERQGGGIPAYNSNIKFHGIIKFTPNIAKTVGGGISLREGSTIFMETITDLSFCKNIAKEYRGGIFVEETLLWERKMVLKCFIQTSNINNTIAFDNNKAGLARMEIFGRWIDLCNPGPHRVRPIHFLKFGRNYKTNFMYTYSDISSNASRVYICKNSIPLINITTFTVTIEVVAVGQRFGVVPAIMNAKFQTQDGNEKIITKLQ